MKKYLLILLLIVPIILFSSDSADTRSDLFTQAAAAYDINDFQKSLDLYKIVLESDQISFELFYNMGDCYYRLNDLGHAVLYWEKAAVLDPGNQDLQHNLKLASLKMQDKVVLPSGFLLFEWYWSVRKSTSFTTLLFISEIILLFTVILIYIPKSRILSLDRRNRLKLIFRYPLIFSVMVLILFSTLSWDKIRYKNENNFAVVVNREVKVKGEPREAANVLFLLHAGSKVKIINQLDIWVEISYFDDKIGWMKSSDIEAINWK